MKALSTHLRVAPLVRQVPGMNQDVTFRKLDGGIVCVRYAYKPSSAESWQPRGGRRAGHRRHCLHESKHCLNFHRYPPVSKTRLARQGRPWKSIAGHFPRFLPSGRSPISRPEEQQFQAPGRMSVHQGPGRSWSLCRLIVADGAVAFEQRPYTGSRKYRSRIPKQAALPDDEDDDALRGGWVCPADSSFKRITSRYVTMYDFCN